MSIETIRNYVRVSNRMASCGQPQPSQFADIVEAGYEAAINSWPSREIGRSVDHAAVRRADPAVGDWRA